jgi:hypothetical protein
VTAATSEEHYTLCGLTYDLALKEYSKYPGTTLGEATTVNNFMLSRCRLERAADRN